MKLIAQEDIRTGEYVTKLWLGRLRRSSMYDKNIFGLSAGNYKKGEFVTKVISQDPLFKFCI